VNKKLSFRETIWRDFIEAFPAVWIAFMLGCIAIVFLVAGAYKISEFITTKFAYLIKLEIILLAVVVVFVIALILLHKLKKTDSRPYRLVVETLSRLLPSWLLPLLLRTASVFFALALGSFFYWFVHSDEGYALGVVLHGVSFGSILCFLWVIFEMVNYDYLLK
jgi:hypothetical protein